MARKPGAEWQIDENVVRSLLASELPHLADLPLRHVAAGWDCDVWRVGDAFALRMPRRDVAIALIGHEQAVLPLVSAALDGTGISIPAPIHVGSPTPEHPWPWSLVPWFDGTNGLHVPRVERRAWAAPLARALLALHSPAPADHPRNPFRGVPLAERSEVVLSRLQSARGISDEVRASATATWLRGVDAPVWQHPPVWIHGDLHPGNLIAHGPRLEAIIDFGDVTAGDPAYDLASAWLVFDAPGRSAFIAAAEGRYDRDTWTRARAWAAAVSALLLGQSDDDPDYRALGVTSIHEASTD